MPTLAARLILAVFISLLLNITAWSRPLACSLSSNVNRMCEQCSVEHIKFKDIIAGRGKTYDGFPFSFSLYESSDGVALSTRIERRGSPANANEELQRQLQKSNEIIEHGFKLGKDGEQVGERFVVVFPATESTKAQTTVLWTEGGDLYLLQSPSLCHVLEFEKRFYRR